MNKLSQYPVIYEQNVAWGDMDAFGHVNNVNYYRYIESARIHYFQELNILEGDIYTVIAHSSCKYLKPVIYPDQLKIAVTINEIRTSAFNMKYLIWSEKQQDFVAEAEAVVVCVDKVNFQKTAITHAVREKINQLESRVGHII